MSTLPVGGLFGGLSPFGTSSEGLYSTLLGEPMRRRPRNRSEWEQRFVHWQRPASETEGAKTDATARRVNRAFARSQFLPNRRWAIIKQGSYHNNTNVRVDSDVDLCMCLTDAFFCDGPPQQTPTMAELGREPTPFTFSDYRAHLAWCLTEEFGASAVTVGTKAIHLHKTYTDKIQADIVPTFVFQQYGTPQNYLMPRTPLYVGVGLLTMDGTLITNYPEQHYAQGCTKTDRTGRRYKRVVRILKSLRNHIADNAQVPQPIRERAKATASFLIESLVFNCPDSLFQHAAIYDDVVSVLHNLSAELHRDVSGLTLLSGPSWMWWSEVNCIKSLFGPKQAWTPQSACAFIDDARAYMGV